MTEADWLIRLLKRHEGCRLHPYQDTVGKLTIGVGRNLSDVGISETEAEVLLANDLQRAQRDLLTALPWVRDLDPVRRVVLTDMAFNLGIGRLLKFQNTLGAVKSEAWDQATAGMLASKWATQVGQRAIRLAQMMRTGLWPEDV